MEYAKRTPLKKMGGGTNLVKTRLLSYLIATLFLIMNILSFGEVPHSYVTENPKKEIQKVETFKQREKAELNLSVTKLKTKKIESKLVNGKLVFDITDKKDIQEGNILVTQGTPYKPNNARIRNANSTQILEATKEANRLEVTGENLQDVYVNVLDSKGQLVGIYSNNIQPRDDIHNGILEEPGNIYFKFTEEYDGEEITIPNQVCRINQNMQPQGIIFVSNDMTYWNEYIVNKVQPGVYLYLNEVPLRIETPWHDSHGNILVHVPLQTIKISEDLIVDIRNTGLAGDYKLKLVKYPNKDFVLNLKTTGNLFERSYVQHRIPHLLHFEYKVLTLRGDSTLTFNEYYPVNEFVQFTNNKTLKNAQPLALDNSIRDVSLDTTGKGLYHLREGDKLTVDGHQVVIGAGGNIGPQKLEIGSLKYTYEVKNGKFRIALNEWGILEPNRTINIKIDTTVEGKAGTATDHNLIIKAPRKVAGTSGVKLNQDYNLGDFVRFNGINLNAPGQASLEQPIAPGVSLTSASGQGIPFMKEGDILQINDGLTRAVKSFTVGANGNLAKQQVSLKSGDLIVYAESGKLRVSAINWVLNKPIKASISLVRGTNKIMDHSLEIQVPDAPFKVTKKGILDFGNVTSGTKRTAETDIGIEMMISDVEIVEFKLKDPNPTMENLTTGDTLAVDKIEYLVIQKDDKKYDIRLKGNLTIPEATKSGTYTGSTTVQLKLR